MKKKINSNDFSKPEILYAKSDMETTLYDHSITVVDGIIRIYNNLPLNLKKLPYLRELSIISAFFHDIGKAHPEFQKLLLKQDNKWENRRHEIISAVFFATGILNKWFEIEIIPNDFNTSDYEFQKLTNNNLTILVFLSILFHHKYLIQNVDRASSQFFTKLNLIKRIPIKRTRPIVIFKDYYMLKERYEEIKAFYLKIKKSLKLLTRKNFKTLNFKFLNEKFPKKDDFFNKDLNISPFFNVDDNFVNEDDASKMFIQDIQKEVFTDNFRYYGSILLGLLKTADHLGSMKISPKKIPLLREFKLGDYTLYPFQKRVKECKSSVILRAPTGSGKTDAALHWAQTNQKLNSRLFYILPFQASLNAMFRRLSNYFNINSKEKNSQIGICHSRNLEFLSVFFEESENSTKGSKFTPHQLKSLTKEVYYPIKLSTAHHLLRFALFGKGWETLILELHNSLIVFDEIHAYEPRILGMLIGLMKILHNYGAKLFIMTATIPDFIIDIIKNVVFGSEDRKLIKKIELNRNKYKDKILLTRVRHKLKIFSYYLIDVISNEENLKTIISRYNNRKKQLFICNTVGSAQQLYEEFIKLEEFNPEEDVLLFHSKFTQLDRQKIEKQLLDNEHQDGNLFKILIATQVVEVSLDIDYDYGYFEIAPIDALIQRMGRINRKCKNIITKNASPNIFIFEKAKHNSLIYNDYLVLETLENLRNIEHIPLTEFDLQKVVEDVYPNFNGEALEEFNTGLHHNLIELHKDFLQIGLQKEWIFEIIENSDNTIEFIPKEYAIKFEEYWNNKEYIKARKLLISTYFKREWKEYLDPIDKYKNFLVLRHPNYEYDKKKGLRKITRTI